MEFQKKSKKRFSFRKWEYTQTTLLLISIIFFTLFLYTEYATALFDFFASLGVIGGFLAGVFFVVTFTTVPAGVVLTKLLPQIGIVELSFFAGLGALVGDLLLLFVLREGVLAEMRPIFRRVKRSSVGKLLRHRFLAWLGPVIGVVALLLPLPDEIGVALLGMVRLRLWQFVIVSFVLNTASFYLLFKGFAWLF